MVGAHFGSQIVEVISRRQAEAIFHIPCDAGHVQDVGHGWGAVDVGHVGPNRLSQHRRFASRALVKSLEASRLAGVQHLGHAFGIEPPCRVPRRAFGHPFRNLNQCAAAQRFAPLAVVHGLVEQDGGQSLTDVTLEHQAIACGVQKHLASHEPRRSTNVGFLVLGCHDAHVALAKFFL